MSLFSKKLSLEDLEELRKRIELINQYKLIVKSLELSNQIYLRNILPKYGLDINKNWEVDCKDGKIKEVKKQQ